MNKLESLPHITITKWGRKEVHRDYSTEIPLRNIVI